MISWVSTEWLRHLMRIIPSGCWEVERPPSCVMSGDHQPYTTNASPARSKNQDSCRFLELIFYVALPPFYHSSLHFPVTSTSLKSIFPTQKDQWGLLRFLLPLPLLSAAESQGSGGSPRFPFLLFSVWKQYLYTYFPSFLVVYDWRLNPILVTPAWLEVEVK